MNSLTNVANDLAEIRTRTGVYGVIAIYTCTLKQLTGVQKINCCCSGMDKNVNNSQYEVHSHFFQHSEPCLKRNPSRSET